MCLFFELTVDDSHREYVTAEATTAPLFLVTARDSDTSQSRLRLSTKDLLKVAEKRRLQEAEALLLQSQVSSCCKRQELQVNQTVGLFPIGASVDRFKTPRNMVQGVP